MHREADARAERVAAGDGRTRLNRATLDFIRDGAPNGERHPRLYSAAANVAELGAPLPLAVALLDDAARDCGLPPADVRRAIENGWYSVQPPVGALCNAVSGEVADVRPADGQPQGGAA